MPNAASTEILLIRHGETLWNIEGRLQGHKDSALTPLGIRQARAIAERVAANKPHVLYTSDLPSASRTAEIICNRIGMAPKPDSRLREQNFGELEGLTISEIPEHLREGQRLRANPDYAMPSGESFRQLHQRAVECITELTDQHPRKRIAVVTHGGILNTLSRHVVGIDLSAPRGFKLFNASLNTILHGGANWALGTWGDIHHLESLKTKDDQ